MDSGNGGNRDHGKALPKYADKLAILASTVAGKPGLHEVDVMHDDWCDMLKGKGTCNCDPEVRLRPK